MHLGCAMIHLPPGALVRVRGERWRVLHVLPHDGCAIAEVAGAGDTNRGITARFILPFEDADPISAAPGPPRIVRAAAWRCTAGAAIAESAPAWSSLRAAASARLTLFPYQLEPVLAMTRGAGSRYLLADEVGLGKTIQAGLLVAELLAREPEARVLLVTPAGLREQWRDELRDRFSLDAEILDAGGLARATARLPPGVNPWAVPRVALTSIDFVKRADVIRALEPIVWDLVAFDEAHALSGRSDRATAAELIAGRARRVVAITATPHTGDVPAFHRLCALGRLAADDPMLLFRRSRADAGLSGGRRVRLLRITPTPAEQMLHRALDAYARRVWRDAPAGSAAAARLAMIVLARRACSSPASLARSIERRLTLLAGEDPTEFQLRLPLDDVMTCEDEEPGAELSAPGLPDLDAERRLLERILDLARLAAAGESKLSALSRLLRRSGEPAIVFTEYRDTLERLSAMLPLPAAHLHGGLTAVERLREVRRFTHGDAHLLLATDAASEGLNLHHRCRLVIHLEIPWTPLRLEQRTGRVDRLGQTRRVHAIGLVSRGTAEESVVEALLERSVIAARDAPFGPDASIGHTGLATIDLRAAAASEAQRLEVWRGFVRHTPAAGGRPVLAVLGRSRGRLVTAKRIAFVDACDCTVWDTLIGSSTSHAGAPCGRARDIRAWFEARASQHGRELENAEDEITSLVLGRLRMEIASWTAPSIAREEDIRNSLRRGDARLAASLVQPGLFDRRSVRCAEAQRRLAQAAAAASAERIDALRRLSDVRIGARRLAFAVVI